MFPKKNRAQVRHRDLTAEIAEYAEKTEKKILLSNSACSALPRSSPARGLSGNLVILEITEYPSKQCLCFLCALGVLGGEMS
jgi:hypothetical protein